MNRLSRIPARRTVLIGRGLPRPSMLVLIALLLLTACGIDPLALPTYTPDPDLRETAAALLPTPVPTTAATATPVARGDASEQIARLLTNMASFVPPGLGDRYLELIAFPADDPTFEAEQRAFVLDWMINRLARYNIELRNLNLEDGTATATLNVAWTTRDSGFSGGADYPVRFMLGEDGQWRYAGELWMTYATEGITLYIAPGLESLAEAILPLLPEVYGDITAALGHTPAAPVSIKLYDNPYDLIATTRLRFDRPVDSWNAPGEAIKLYAARDQSDPLADATYLPPEQFTLAYEFARAVLFDLGEDAGARLPYWLQTGLADYAAAQDFLTLTQRNQRINAARALLAGDQFLGWDQLADFAALEREQWVLAPLQGYAFAAYVSETFGVEARNTWLARIATDLDLADSTREVLGLSFSELDQDFRTWLLGT